MSKGTIFHGHVIAVQDGYYWVESRRRRAAARVQRPPARRSFVRCVSAQPPPRAQLAAASLPAARTSKFALPALDFRGLPWTPLCGPGLGLGLHCALGPRRTVAKRSEEKTKKTFGEYTVTRTVPLHFCKGYASRCKETIVYRHAVHVDVFRLLEPDQLTYIQWITKEQQVRIDAYLAVVCPEPLD